MCGIDGKFQLQNNNVRYQRFGVSLYYFLKYNFWYVLGIGIGEAYKDRVLSDYDFGILIIS